MGAVRKCIDERKEDKKRAKNLSHARFAAGKL
nr:MAG TPA: hypothetical protein [Caudoviricetes sp.]